MRSKEEIMEEIKELLERDYTFSSYGPVKAYDEGFLDALEWVMELANE